MAKAQIFHPYIIDAFKLVPASTHPIIGWFSNFWDWFLVDSSTNVISKSFHWFVLNGSRKTCLAVQCVRIAVCSTGFFHKSKFIFKNSLLKFRQNVFPGNFDFHYHYFHYCYCTFIHRWSKEFSHNLKCYQNFKNHHLGKLRKTCLMNSRNAFWNLSFCFCLSVHKLDDTFTFIWKKILCYIFLFLCHMSYEYGVSINSKISFVSSGDKLILTSQPQIFADFDIKIVLLDQFPTCILLLVLKFPNVPKKLMNIFCCLQHKSGNYFQAEGTRL